MTYAFTVEYTGFDPAMDKILDDLAAPGVCGHSGYLFTCDARDREYEFEDPQEAEKAANRIQEDSQFRVLGWVEERETE